MAQRTLRPYRRQALSLFRKIIRTSYSWESQEPEYTEKERRWIRREARVHFRAYQNVTDPELIEKKLFDGSSRLELAVYYGIPYPRPVYSAKGTTQQKIQSQRQKFGQTEYEELVHGPATEESRVFLDYDADPDYSYFRSLRYQPFSPSREREKEERKLKAEDRTLGIDAD